MKLKCRKCREFLMDSSCLVDSHGKPSEDVILTENNCIEDQAEPVWNVNYDAAPDWMKSFFDQGNWLKGKILCPKCDGRVGSYNFTQPRKCGCGQSVSPPVWLMKSRIDASIPPVLRQSKPAVIDDTWTVIKTSVPDAISPKQSKSMSTTPANASLLDHSPSSDEMKHLKSIMSCDYNASDSTDTDTQEFTLASMARSREQRQKLIDRRRKKIRKHKSRPEEKLKKCESTLQKLLEKLFEEYKCPICLDLCVKPTQCFPCEHVFCRLCLDRINKMNEDRPTCPLCRNFIRNCKMAKDLDSFLKNAFPLRCEPEQNQNAEKSDSEYFDSSSTGIWYQQTLLSSSSPSMFWGNCVSPMMLFSVLIFAAASLFCYAIATA